VEVWSKGRVVAVLVTADPYILEARLVVRDAHSRFEYEGSSATEARLYDEFAETLAAGGFPLCRIDNGEVSPQVAVGP
jgi:hypothetical protein